MKTEFQARLATGHQVSGPWTGDLKFLRENYRRSGNTLWPLETETPEESAVRRRAALDKAQSDRPSYCTFSTKAGESLSQFADRLSPPPAVNETRVDWDTLEPIKEVPVWKNVSRRWVAGVDMEEFCTNSDHTNLNDFFMGKITIGHTRESALRNLEELKSIQK